MSEEIRPVAWCEAEILARLDAGLAVLADLSAVGGNICTEPLYSSATVAALVAERDEALEQAKNQKVSARATSHLLFDANARAKAAEARVAELEAENERLRMALIGLEKAARQVLGGINDRIDAAPKTAVPVFRGVVDLNDALSRARAAFKGGA